MRREVYCHKRMYMGSNPKQEYNGFGLEETWTQTDTVNCCIITIPHLVRKDWGSPQYKYF